MEIGQTNSLDAVVFDNQINVNEGYAELKTATDGFTLSTLDGAANFSVGVDIISLTSDKSTTIYTDLVKDGHATIHTSDSKTTFKVTASGTSDTFTVTSGIADNPKIENATEITLLTGSITATKGQTIKLGNSASAKSITFTDDSADMLVTYNSSDSTFTVSTPTTTGGTAGGEFTFNNNTYKVDGGNGMTFTLGSTEYVTIGGLSSDDDDAFSYAGTAYSVKGAGFIKGGSTNPSLWANPSITSVVAQSLTSASWRALTTVDGADKVQELATQIARDGY